MNPEQNTVGESLPWRQENWRETADGWVRRVLETQEARVDRKEVVKDGSWSFVQRIHASDGDYYFKAVGPRMRFEAGLTDFLYRRFPEDNVVVVAHDVESGWLLLRDAGIKLRETPEFYVDSWYQLLPRYARLQIALMPEADALLAAGTPDLRFPHLPALYARLIEDAYTLFAHTAFRLSTDEKTRLCERATEFDDLCEELASSGIPPTIDHGDLHGGNVFVKAGIARFADWGDACIAHPLMSLLVPGNVFQDHFDLAPDAPEMLCLRDIYLEPFERFASRKTLLRASEIALRIAMIFRAHSWHCALSTLTEPLRAPYAENALYWLRAWAGIGLQDSK